MLSARSEATTRRTYCRPKDGEGTKFETWDQVIQRSHWEHHLKLWKDAGGEVDYNELQELVNLGYERSGLVSGRTLWLGGTEYAYSRAASQFNCSGLRIETVYDAVDSFWLLLNGSGVGGRPKAGTLHGFPRRIPELKIIPSTQSKDHRGRQTNEEVLPSAENDYTWTIRVADSATGWCKVPGKMLISPRTRTDRLVIDFSDCRGKGGRLKGYGWICNGFEPFATAMAAIFDVLNRNAGNLLGEEDIGDIFNWFGTVLSSRRAAEALMLDADHPHAGEFARRKKDYWLNGNDQRRQSNNSLLFWRCPSVADIADLLKLNLVGGEPGFVNAEAALRRCPWFDVFNPCFEIALPSAGFCVSGETLLMTETGVTAIKDAVGTTVKVWNGEKWARVKPTITGEGQQLVRVKLSDGSHLDCTPEHRFSVLKRKWTCHEKKAKHLSVGDVMEPFTMGEGVGAVHVSTDAAYTLGVLVGDGSAEGLRKPERGKWAELTLYASKKHLPVLGVKGEEYLSSGYRQTAVKVKDFAQPVFDQSGVDVANFVHSARIDQESIKQVFSWSREAALAFLAGLADTDGSETGTGGIRIYSTHKKLCELVQLLLRKCGVRSSLCLMAGIGSKTNWGLRDKEMWYVQVTECQTIPCHRLDTSRGHAPGGNGKGQYQKVVSIESLPGLHTVYCFNEPEKHKGVFGNVLTHQCNLVSLCLPMFGRDFARLERAVHVMARANYRQTCVNLNDGVLQPKWHQTNESLRLCGVSFTGVTQAGWLTDYHIKRLRNAAVAGAYSMADELGMPYPKAVTTLKPEGTRSKISGKVGMEIKEGMHQSLGRHILNWVNFSVNDPLVQGLEQAGYKTLPNPSDKNNVLVRFPLDFGSDPTFVQDERGAWVCRESALTQLRRYRRWNTLWADHNCSATISFDESEIPEMAQWIHRNWGNAYVATAFQQRVDPSLTAKDLGHPYLPQEVVTESEYEQAVSQTRPVDWDKYHHGIHELDEAGCAGGVCPIK